MKGDGRGRVAQPFGFRPFTLTDPGERISRTMPQSCLPLLVDHVRVRVDTTVSEAALWRVLPALKAWHDRARVWHAGAAVRQHPSPRR